MQLAIERILDEVPSNHIFDSHFVIAQLIKRYSDQYLEFASSIDASSSDKTRVVHGQIGRKIDTYAGEEKLLRRLGSALR